MGISRVGQGSSYPSSAITYTIVGTGNLLVVCAGWDDNTSNPTISDTKVNTWNSLTVIHGSGLGQSSKLFYCLSTNATGSDTITVSGGVSDQGLELAEYNTTLTTWALDNSNTVESAGANPSTTGVTTAQNNEVFVGYLLDEANTFGTTSSYTQIVVDAAHYSIMMELLTNTAGTNSFSVTRSASASGALLTFAAFKDSGGAGDVLLAQGVM